MANYELGNLVWRVKGDATDFDRQIGGATTRLQQFGQKARQVGANLTKFVTLPLAGLGIAGVKAASDLGESINAVNVVFRDAAGVVTEFGEDAAEAVGLSQTAFNELATVIGAQLKQSGLDIDDVADSTIELTTRAADLASVFNVEVSEATTALGAALRGESEPARRFGINISDAAVQAEALASGLVSSRSEITDSIKVQARYNLILRQSADVAGDFANTSDSLANQTRILKADLANTAAELGTALLPIVTDVVSAVRDAVGRFADLDESTKKLILILGGVAAAAGPAISAIGVLSTSIAFLAANPIVALVGALAGAGVAVATLGRIAREAELERIREDLGPGLEEEVRDSGAALDLLANSIIRNADAFNTEFGDNLDTVRGTVAQLADSFDVTEATVIRIGANLDSVNAQYREQLQILEAEQDALDEQLSVYERAAAQRRQAYLDEQAAIAERIEAEEREREAAAERNRIASEYRDQIRGQYEELIDSLTAVDEIEALERERVRAIEDANANYVRSGQEIDLINTYYDLQIAKAQELRDIEAERAAEEARLAEANRIKAERQEAFLKAQERAEADAAAKAEERARAEAEAAAAEEERRALTEERIRLQAEADAEQANNIVNIARLRRIAEQNALEATEERIAAEIEAEAQKWDTLESLANTYASSLGEIFDNLTERRLNLVDRETQAKIDALDEELLGEEAYEDAVTALKQQAAIDKWEIEKELFGVRKAAAIAQIAIDTATAIQKGYADLGPVGGTIAAVILGALGATQAALVASEPPPARPAFATGGTFMTDGPQTITVGDNPGGRERVSIEPVGSSGGGNGPMTVIVDLDGRTIATSTVDYVNNGVVRLEAR